MEILVNKLKENKVAIVTGGAQGIGKAIVRNFVVQGIYVIMVDNDLQAGNETEEEFKNSNRIKFLHADISKEADIKKVVKSAASVNGNLNILVNNAGITHFKPMNKISLKEWNLILSVNLTGAFLMSKYTASKIGNTRGSIVNIASTRALMSEQNTEAYSASKGGIVALTHAMAMSLGPKVRVNCISPGWIETSEWKKKKERHKPKHSKQDLDQHPAGRVGKPEDIAFLVDYLVSDKAEFITGANFVVDGGMTRKMIYV